MLNLGKKAPRLDRVVIVKGLLIPLFA